MSGAGRLRRAIQREIEDSLSEKILFGELRPGHIVVVDTEGAVRRRPFTFRGEEKSALPDVPPSQAAGGAGPNLRRGVILGVASGARGSCLRPRGLLRFCPRVLYQREGPVLHSTGPSRMP